MLIWSDSSFHYQVSWSSPAAIDTHVLLFRTKVQPSASSAYVQRAFFRLPGVLPDTWWHHSLKFWVAYYRSRLVGNNRSQVEVNRSIRILASIRLT